MSVALYPGVALFKARVRAGEELKGTFLQLGSVATAEIAARAGFDWVMLDQEHGMGGEDVTLAQLTAIAGTPAVPIVRVAWHEPTRFKRALDAGACGVMVPYVETADAAARAVAAIRYPPRGIRGLAKFTRAANYGAAFDEVRRRWWVGRAVCSHVAQANEACRPRAPAPPRAPLLSRCGPRPTTGS